MRSLRSRLRARWWPLVVIPLTALAVAPAASAHGSDIFNTSLFADESDALWPIEVKVELTPLDAHTEHAPFVHRQVVSDGHKVQVAHVFRSGKGLHDLQVEVVPRKHAGKAVELEYDLSVRESAYERVTLGAYVLHRLNLGPGPEVEAPALRSVKADIVSVRDRAHTVLMEVGTVRYEVRLAAATVRG